jgi:hypothetical protein
VFRANKEKDYATFFHVIQPTEILDIRVLGDVEISFIGFGDESKRKIAMLQTPTHLSDLQPAPPVGFNLTFTCPEGEVTPGVASCTHLLAPHLAC